jgi:cytochrome c-type biogenesis protein CcmH
MAGWLIMALLTGLTFGGLMLFVRERSKLWSALAAAMVLALAGYATQGQPSLPSAPAMPIAEKGKAAEALLSIRAEMDYQYSASKRWMIISDGFARNGKYRMAAALLQSAIRKEPRNADLWSALGLVLMLAGDGELTPPAKFAFEKARQFNPRHPAPDYFAGLAMLFKQDPVATVALWKPILANAPAKAKWRPRLESQLAGLERMIAASQPLPSADFQPTESER